MSWLILANGGILSGVVIWYFKGRIAQLMGMTGKVKDDEDGDMYDPEEGGGWQPSESDGSVRSSSYSSDAAYPRPRHNKSSDPKCSPHQEASYQVPINYDNIPRTPPVFHPLPQHQTGFPSEPARGVPPPKYLYAPPPVHAPPPQFAPPPYVPNPANQRESFLPTIPQHVPAQVFVPPNQWHQPLPLPMANKKSSKRQKNLEKYSVDEIDPSELELGEVLGGGSFGMVHRARWHGTHVAVKVLKVDQSKGSGEVAALEEFQREVAMLSRLRHPNICLFMGCCMKEGQHTIVTELVGRGSLWDVLREAKLCATPLPSVRGEWTWDRLKLVANGIACGMAYMHGIKPQAVLHRDLKSSNILCDESYCPKICDFGLSRLKAQVSSTILSTRLEQAAMTGNCGTIQWMAPEVLANQKYSETADVYSFGIILWELLVRKCPYEGMAQVSVALAVVQHGTRPPIPAQCPQLYRELIETCWAQQASHRPSFKRILEEGTLDAACGPHSNQHKQARPAHMPFSVAEGFN